MELKLEILDLGDGNFRAQLVGGGKLLMESEDFENGIIDEIGNRHYECNAFKALKFKVLDNNFNWAVANTFHAAN